MSLSIYIFEDVFPDDKKCYLSLSRGKMLEEADTKFYSELVKDNSSNPRALFKVFNNMLNKQIQFPLPLHDYPAELADVCLLFNSENGQNSRPNAKNS